MTTVLSVSDVGGLQVRSYSQEGAQGASADAPAVRLEAAEAADQVPGATVEEVEHEDPVCHLSDCSTSTRR